MVLGHQLPFAFQTVLNVSTNYSIHFCAGTYDHSVAFFYLPRKIRENTPLKCFQHLEIKGGVSDPKKGRNRRKTPDERRNPQIVEKEKTAIQNGVVK